MSIYFDNASTSYPKPIECLSAIEDYLVNYGVSTRSDGGHLGDRVSLLLGRAKEKLAEVLGEDVIAENLFFTMNATHSLNLVLRGLLEIDDHVITCVSSHNSVLRVIQHCKNEKNISCDIWSSHSIEQLDQMINKNTKAVVLNHCSNVTGEVVDFIHIASYLRGRGIKLILDVTQSAGVFDAEYGVCDYLVGTGHKSLLGPTGVGFFYAKDPYSIKPLLFGGTGSMSYSAEQPWAVPDRFESGTPNITCVAGLLGSLEYYLKNKGVIFLKRREVLQYALECMKKVDGIKIDCLSPAAPIISFHIIGADPANVSSLYDKYGIIVRSGFHCAPLIHKKLGNMNGSIRLSFSHYNSKEQVDYFIEKTKLIIANKMFIKVKN